MTSSRNRNGGRCGRTSSGGLIGSAPAWLVLGQGVSQVGGGVLGADLVPGVLNQPAFIYQEGRADDAQIRVAVHLLLPPHPEGLGHLVVGIRQQRIPEIAFLVESLLAVGLVPADAHCGDSAFCGDVTHADCLVRSTRGERLGKEEDRQLPSGKVAQRHLVAVLIFQVECRRRIAGR